MNIKEIKWPAVVLVLGLAAMTMAAVVYLTHEGQDTTAVLTFAGALAAAVGLTVVNSNAVQVKEQTNGNTSKMLDMLAEDRRWMAAMQASPELMKELAFRLPANADGEAD